MVLKNLLTGQQWRNGQRKNSMDMGRGEGERCGESNVETHITVCKIDSQRELAVWLRKLKQALNHPRGVGWGGRWEEVQKGGDMCIPMADSC